MILYKTSDGFCLQTFGRCELKLKPVIRPMLTARRWGRYHCKICVKSASSTTWREAANAPDPEAWFALKSRSEPLRACRGLIRNEGVPGSSPGVGFLDLQGLLLRVRGAIRPLSACSPVHSPSSIPS